MFRNVSTAPKPANGALGASNGSPPRQGAFNGATVTPSGQRYRPMDDPVFTSTWQSRIYPQHQEYFIHDKQGKPTVRADCQAQAQSAYIQYRLMKLELTRHLPIILTDGKMVDGENTASARQKRIEIVAGLYAGHPHIERVTDKELVEAFPPPQKTRDPVIPWQKLIFKDNKELFAIDESGNWAVKPASLSYAKKVYIWQRLKKLEQMNFIVEGTVAQGLMLRKHLVELTDVEQTRLLAYVQAKTFNDTIARALHYVGNPDEQADEFLIRHLKTFCKDDFDHHFAVWDANRCRVVESQTPIEEPAPVTPSINPYVVVEGVERPFLQAPINIAQPSAPPLEPTPPVTVPTSTWDVSQSDHEKYLLIKGLVKYHTKDGLQPFLEFALDARYASPYPELYLLITGALTCGDDEPVKKVRVNELCKRILKLTRGIMADEYFANNQKPMEGHELQNCFAKAFWQACNKDQIRVQLQSVIRDPNAPPSFAFAVAQ